MFLDHTGVERFLQRQISPHRREVVIEALKEFVQSPNGPAWRWDIVAHHNSLVATLPEPPRSAEGITAWAAKQGVADALQAPAADALALADAHLRWSVGRREGTVAALLGTRGVYGGPSPESAVVAYLRWAIKRRALAAHRAKTWRRRPRNHALRVLAIRLEDALDRLDPASDRPVALSRPELTVLKDPPGARVILAGRSGALERTLSFAGYEDLPLSLDHVVPDSEHRVLIEWTLDALHDPDSPLRPALQTALGKPSWERLVERMEVASQRKGAEPSKKRVAFRVFAEEAQPLRVIATLQKQAKRGWSRGQEKPAKSLLEHSAATAQDRVALERLSRAEESPSAQHRWRQAHVLAALVGHPRVSLERSSQHVQVVGATPVFALEPDIEGRAGHRLVFRLDKQPVDRVGDEPWLAVFDAEENIVRVAGLSRAVRTMAQVSLEHPAILPPDADPRVLTALTRLQPDAGLAVPPSLRGDAREADAILVARLEPDEVGLGLGARRSACGRRPLLAHRGGSQRRLWCRG